MSELFNNLKSAILEAIESCKQSYDESSSNGHSEELEWHECDGITTCPNKPSDDTQEELEQNMLLRDLGRGGE